MAPRKKRSTGKGKPSRATGPGLSIMSDPTRRGGMWPSFRKRFPYWKDSVIAATDPTRLFGVKNGKRATKRMGREISPATAMSSLPSRGFGDRVGSTGPLVVTKNKMNRGWGKFSGVARTPSSGPSVGSISQPIDQAPPRSYKAALAQNIANGERQRMRPFLEAQPELSPAKSLLKEKAYHVPRNKGKKKAGPPPSTPILKPPKRGRTIIRKSRSKNY